MLLGAFAQTEKQGIQVFKHQLWKHKAFHGSIIYLRFFEDLIYFCVQKKTEISCSMEALQ